MENLEEQYWDHYSGLPSPAWYAQGCEGLRGAGEGRFSPMRRSRHARI